MKSILESISDSKFQNRYLIFALPKTLKKESVLESTANRFSITQTGKIGINPTLKKPRARINRKVYFCPSVVRSSNGGVSMLTNCPNSCHHCTVRE